MRAVIKPTGKLVVIKPQDNLGRARNLMYSGNFRHLPVVEGEKLVGILSYSDMRNLEDSDLVNDAMAPNPMTATPETTIEQAAREMLDFKITAMPITIKGKVVKILSTSDILEALLQLKRTEPVGVFLKRTVRGLV